MLTVNVKDFGAESITEGTVMEWRAQIGQMVKKGEVIAAIETDKVTVDVVAEQDGVLAEILVKADETAAKDQPLYVLNLDGTASTASSPSSPTAAPTTAAASPLAPTGDPVIMMTPDFGAESITEGSLMEWRAKVGDFVKKGSIIAAIETDKVTVEAIAAVDGYLTEIFVKVDETAVAGEKLCIITPGAAPAGGDAPAPTPASTPVPAPTPAPSTPAPAATSSTAAAPEGRIERREKMKRMRLAIAKNLKASQSTLAQLTTFQEVDMTGAMAFRKEYKDLFEQQHGSRLTFNSIFFKASAFALEQIPSLNAYIDSATDEIVFRDYVDISFAASNSRGLITPVVRNVEKMSILQVEKSFSELASKAKADKLSLDETMGASFTITNGGVFGSMLSTPLIGSTTQSAVLGLHAIKNRATVLKSGEIASRPIMFVALTYDHRMVDGREAVTFLRTIKDMVEDPRRLMLGC